jgi:hypothetical protein
VHGKAAFWSNQCESIWSKYCSTGPAHRLVSDLRSCRANVVSTPLMLEEWRATQASHRRMSSGLATSLAALFKLTPFSIPSFCATELHHRHLYLPLAAGLHHRTPLLFFLPDFAIAAVLTRHNSPHRLAPQLAVPTAAGPCGEPLPPAGKWDVITVCLLPALPLADQAAATVRWRLGVAVPEAEAGRGYRARPRPSRPCGPSATSLWARLGRAAGFILLFSFSLFKSQKMNSNFKIM